MDFLLKIPGELQQEAADTTPQGGHKGRLTSSGPFIRTRLPIKKGQTKLILTSPIGKEVTYASRFDFGTSNNEAEYEALLAGLRLAVKMGAKRVMALTDSRLAANQVLGEFEAKDKRMEKYVKAVQQIMILLKSFTIK